MSRTMTTNNPFATCPACKNEIHAEYEIDLGSLEWDSFGASTTGTAVVTLRGVRLSHDCFTKQTRGDERNRKYHTEDELRQAT